MQSQHLPDNPYAIPSLESHKAFPTSQEGPARLSIDVLGLFTRAWQLVKGQYWMLLVITFVGILIGTLVPMNLLLGAMVVGMYLTLSQVARGEKAEFTTLFRGFDQFFDSLMVIIAFTVLNIAMMVPVMVLYFAFIIANATAQGQSEPGLGFFLIMMSVMPLAFMASFLAYLPFLFSFQLIADRKINAMDAIKQSLKAVWVNLGGILLYLVVLGFLSVVLLMMCYLPIFFFMPISMASSWILYRDIFPEPIVEASLV